MMTRIQFDDWLRKVRTMFPSVADWLKKLSDDDLNATREFWYSKLRRLDPIQCDDALESLLMRDKNFFTKDFFKLVYPIAKRLKPETKEVFNGETLSTCPNFCSMDGFVYVRDYSQKKFEYHWNRIAAQIANRIDPIPGFLLPGLHFLSLATAEQLTERDWREMIARREPATILCNCERGDRDFGEKAKKLPRFDAESFTLRTDADRLYIPARNGFVELPNEQKGDE